MSDSNAHDLAREANERVTAHYKHFTQRNAELKELIFENEKQIALNQQKLITIVAAISLIVPSVITILPTFFR